MDNTSLTVREEENTMDNLLEILHNFGIAFGLKINKSIAYWCGQETSLGWVEQYQWKWATSGDLSKLFGTPFGLQLELQDVDQFLIDKVKTKLEY